MQDFFIVIKHTNAQRGSRTMSNYGRERYKSLRINLNSKNQASETWLKFLRLFKINTVPVKLDQINGGLFRYQYSNANKSICIWTQHRPDQNTIRPGHAGTVVVRVEDNSTVPFGKLRSALVRISNVPPLFTRMTSEQTQDLAMQLQDQPDPVNTQDLIKHESTLKDLNDSRFSSFDDFGLQYTERNKMKTTLTTATSNHSLVVLSRKLAVAGVANKLVTAATPITEAHQTLRSDPSIPNVYAVLVAEGVPVSRLHKGKTKVTAVYDSIVATVTLHQDLPQVSVETRSGKKLGSRVGHLFNIHKALSDLDTSMSWLLS